jgi:protease-4
MNSGQMNSPQMPPGGFGPPPGFYGPPMPMPMPMMPPPGMFRPQKSFARVIFTTLASIIFGLSITLNIYLLAFSGLSGGLGGGSHGIIQSVIVQGDPKEKIALVPINEPIWEPTAQKFDAIMTAIENDPNIKAVVLEIETPGGTVTASDEIYARIGRFKKKMEGSGRKVPVVVTMGAIAASGGYYVACASDHIIAQRTTITGSIGVIFPMINAAELARKYGVKEISIAAPENGMKNAGSWLSDLKEEERKYLQKLVDDFYGTFTSVVIGGRGTRLTKPLSEIADGRVFTASEALNLGLVDQIGYPTDAYDKAGSMAQLSNKHVVRYTPKPPTLFEMLSAESKSGIAAGQGAGAHGATGTVTINGVNVNVDVRALLDELGRPRALYLWRGH